ncbi:MAG: peptide ABC transporter substrate-binding protein [Proteobacteria bacterium]|nr:peptide ABC transporter substrate-binding protein [Pseudomonadota bacterium]MCP4915576.1 peptide ABC transporter substrate-binding protein [Pseudomonadota bacterium]
MILLLGCLADGPTFGLSRADQDPKTFVFNNASEPEYIDPTQATGHPDGRIVGELFDGLTEYDPVDLSPRPSMALSWDLHPDGRGYTFHLRDDAAWSDGTPITAHDVAWSWEHVLNPIYLGRYAQQLYLLERGPLYNASRVFRHGDHEVEAVDSLQVTLLEGPGPLGDLSEGDLVALTGQLRHNEVEVSYRAACPSLSDLPALLDCTGDPVTAWVPEDQVEPAWPLSASRVLERDAVLSTVAGPKLPLSRGEEILALHDGRFFYSTSEATGTLDDPGAAIDPRAEHIRYRVVPLDDIDWDGIPEPDTGAHAPGEEPPVVPVEVTLSELSVDPGLVGVRVEDDHTLTVRLSGVAPFFLQLTSHTTTRPANQTAWETHGSRWTRPENIVTSGPFTLEEHVVRDRFEMKKNPTWWGADELYFDAITAYSIDNLHTSANLYRAGYTDLVVANDIPAEFLPILKDKDDFHVSPALSVYVYRINTTKPPFDDVRVRRALAMTIKKDDIVTVLKAGQIPATSLVPPGLPGYPSVPGPEYDPEEARRLLAEAGYPNGEGFPKTTILYNTLESHKLVAAIVQDNWARELGIEIELTNSEWKTYLKTVNNLDYDIARGGWIGDYLDPLTFLDLWIADGGNNNTGWSSTEYERLLAEAGVEPDAARRLELLAESEQILNDEMPFIPIYWYVWTELVQPDVVGTTPNLLDQHPIRYMSIER